MSATVTEMTGDNTDPARYHSGFAVFNNGDVGSGYGIFIARSGSLLPTHRSFSSTATSATLGLMVMGTAVSRIHCPRFSSETQVRMLATFFADGRVTGRITSDAQTFDFAFGPRRVVSAGTNFTIFQVFPSSQNFPNPIYPTLDDVAVSAIPGSSPYFYDVEASDPDGDPLTSHSPTFRAAWRLTRSPALSAGPPPSRNRQSQRDFAGLRRPRRHRHAVLRRHRPARPSQSSSHHHQSACDKWRRRSAV